VSRSREWRFSKRY